MWTRASALSYSKWPASKVPTTLNCLRRGTTPAGVTCPPGATSVTLSPVATPSDARELAAEHDAEGAGHQLAEGAVAQLRGQRRDLRFVRG